MRTPALGRCLERGHRPAIRVAVNLESESRSCQRLLRPCCQRMDAERGLVGPKRLFRKRMMFYCWLHIRLIRTVLDDARIRVLRPSRRRRAQLERGLPALRRRTRRAMSDPDALRGIGGRAAAVLAIVCCAQLILAVDITIILVADVQIKQALGFGEASLSWIVTAYALTFGGLLLLAGRLCDSFGHRRMFLVGMAAFGLASGCAALSADPLELVLSRAAQGVSAAMVSPAALALLGDEFTDGPRRSRAFGFWAASGSAGGVIGYTVGGVLVGYLGWRWAFIINLPITAAGIIAGRRYLPARAVSAAGRRLPLLGAASITVGLGLLIDALGQGESAGWGSITTLAAAGGALAGIAAFTVHETRSPDPLIALAVLRRRESAASVCAALQAAPISAAVYLGSLYLQQVLGDSPERVGIATLPVPLGVAAGAYTVTRLLRRGRSRHYNSVLT